MKNIAEQKARIYHLDPTISAEAALERWRARPFYESAVVLGVDVGLEGIGVCLRKGGKILRAATWIFPWPKSLSDRRQARAARRCRKNRRIRLRRLAELCRAHDLPWHEDRDPALLRTDPFELRHRAVTTGLQKNAELSLAIRHVVAHRGHDYSYYAEDEEVGDCPWGELDDFQAAKVFLSGGYFLAEEAEKLLGLAQNAGWSDERKEEFSCLLRQRTLGGGQDPLAEHLAAYIRQPRRDQRRSPRGLSLPRSVVWMHLEAIVRKNAGLLRDAEGFLRALAVRPEEDKSRAIFFYHRKTPAEMRAHFEKKTAKCRHARWLGLGDDLPCAGRSDPHVFLFNLLEFLATRRVELKDGRRAHLPASALQALIEWGMSNNPTSPARASWAEAKKIWQREVEAGLGARPALSTPFAKDYLLALQDMIRPPAARLRRKARLSSEAARRLFEVATAAGFEPAAIVSALADYFRHRREAVFDPAGRFPQVEFLLGAAARRSRTRTARHPNRLQEGEVAVEGRLQRLFREHAAELGGKTAPDYAVIEVIRDAPASEKQKAAIQEENRKRREEHLKNLAALPPDAVTSRSARLRLKLHRQQKGLSPFTGAPLGEDALASHLQICHLFPVSRGGLAIEDNLVLAPVKENQIMGNRTPREAAADLAGSWQAMLAHTRNMAWPGLKRELYEWNSADIPDFGNTTRMSQLARQLYAAMARWMGIPEIADPSLRENRRAERLGTPAGHLTAACRAAWRMPRKDREQDLAHHMVDAITLSFIPPREGLNSVACGGIFYDQPSSRSGGVRLSALPLGPDPAEVERLFAEEAPDCPVLEFARSSSKGSRHDKTNLRLRPDGKLFFRRPLHELKMKGQDAVSVRQALLDSGVPQGLIPADREINDWLDAPDGRDLLLANGTPIRHFLQKSGKGGFFPLLGRQATPNASGGWSQIRILAGSNFRSACLHRAWNPRRRKWEFFLRRTPEPAAIEAALRTCFAWLEAKRGEWPEEAPPPALELLETWRRRLRARRTAFLWRKIAASRFARKLLKAFAEAGFPFQGASGAGWEAIESVLYGRPLPEGARVVHDPRTGRAARLSKGSLFLAALDVPGTPRGSRHWMKVTAIKRDDTIELVAVRVPGAKARPYGPAAIAELFGAKPDDPPPHPS